MTYEVVIKCPDMDDASDVLERAIYIFDSHLVQMRNVGSSVDVYNRISKPAQVKIVRNSKVCDYEISIHAGSFFDTDGIPGAVELALAARKKLESELYGSGKDGKRDANSDTNTA